MIVCMIKTKSMRTIVVRGLLLSALGFLSPGITFAADEDGATILISNSLAKVTRAEYEAELTRLPPDLRAGFGNSPRRVNDLLTRMLMRNSLAANARNAKLDTAPDNVRRIQMETDRLLSQFYIELIEASAAAEFEATRSRYEARAREVYLAERSRFERPEQLVATHVLFDTKKRSSDDAKALASATRARIIAGADMGSLAKELSDDPSAQSNAGKLDWFSRKEMDSAFATAAFGLANPGDISEPVLSQFGWHVIRLDARRPAGVPPFDQVRVTLMAEFRKAVVDERREAALVAIRRDPETKVDSAAVEALIHTVDLEAVKRTIGVGAPGASSPAAMPAPR